jgi:hypothetical protein
MELTLSPTLADDEIIVFGAMLKANNYFNGNPQAKSGITPPKPRA